MRRIRTLAVTTLPMAVAAGAVVFGFAGPVSAADPDCRTATTTLTGRPDSGLHGDWAKDDLTRTVRICETTRGVDGGKSAYSAIVGDKGVFTSIAGNSPNAGTPLAAGITGKVIGGFTATFQAEPDFKNYKGGFDEKSYSGTDPASTTEWVQKLWGGDDFTSVTNLVGWKWAYWTCSPDIEHAVERWVNADPDVNDGDITGKPCPSPSASPSAAPSAAPSAGAPAGGGGGGTLPITGSQTALYAGGAVILLAAGAGLVLAGRRRRDSTA